LLQLHIHEYGFISSWVCYKKCLNEWYKKALSLFTLTIAWEIARSPRSGVFGSNLISDQYAAIFATENHNKTENEILGYKTL
jgi:hypothetical protein